MIFALLYLDTLEVEEFVTRKAFGRALEKAQNQVRPYQVLRFVERAGRKLWAPRETNYLTTR